MTMQKGNPYDRIGMRGKKGTDMSKKIKVMLLVALLTTTGVIAGYWTDVFLRFSLADREKDDLSAFPLQYAELQTERWDADALIDARRGSQQDLLLHNNGRAMQHEFYDAGADGAGSDLIAVYCSERGGSPCESYYFSNRPLTDKEELLQYVETEQRQAQALQRYAKQMQGFGTEGPLAATDIAAWDLQNSGRQQDWDEELPQIYGEPNKEFCWYFYDTDTDRTDTDRTDAEPELLARLFTGMCMECENADVDINGVPGSLWSVRTRTTLERMQANLRLHARQIKIGAVGTERLVHDLQQNEDEELRVKYRPSLSENYAMWEYRHRVFANPVTMTAETEAVFSNIDGDMQITLTQQGEIQKLFSRETLATGTLRIRMPDSLHF